MLSSRSIFWSLDSTAWPAKRCEFNSKTIIPAAKALVESSINSFRLKSRDERFFLGLNKLEFPEFFLSLWYNYL
jgi:hypothetical protein